MSDWRQQEECEQQRWEEEQQMLRDDPGYSEWLESVNAQRKEQDHGDQRDQ
jgi:hypothetical protein